MMKTRKSYKAKPVRINLLIPGGLLDLLDQAAEKDFTSRSEIIRSALLWYLRPQGRDLAETDIDKIVDTLNRRRLSVQVRKNLQKDA